MRVRQLKGTCQNCKQCFHIKCLKDIIDDIVFGKTCYIRPAEKMTMHDDRRKNCYDNLRSHIVKSGPKILHRNVNGFLSKIDMIRDMFDSLNKNINVFGVKDSKLNSTIIDTEVHINGYVGIQRDRTSGAGGGEVVFVRDDLNLQRRTDLENQMIEADSLALVICKILKVNSRLFYIPTPKLISIKI